MDSTTYLMIANVAVLAGVAGYVAFLGARTASLARRMRRLEILGEHDE